MVESLLILTITILFAVCYNAARHRTRDPSAARTLFERHENALKYFYLNLLVLYNSSNILNLEISMKHVV